MPHRIHRREFLAQEILTLASLIKSLYEPNSEGSRFRDPPDDLINPPYSPFPDESEILNLKNYRGHRIT